MLRNRLGYSLLASISLFATQSSQGAGFDAQYEVMAGDYNNDGHTDLLVRKPPQVLILHGEILTPVVLPDDVTPFVLVVDPTDRTFEIQAAGNAIDLGDWSPTDVELTVRDVNFDRVYDAQLNNVSTYVSGARNQLVIADSDLRSVPVSAVSLTDDVADFMSETLSWMLDQNFFADNSPWVVVDASPPPGVWFGSIRQGTDLYTVNLLLSWCFETGADCAVSEIDPPVCEVLVDQYDSRGVYIGTATINVCTDRLHVYRYPPSSVILARDRSFFHPKALEFVDAIYDVSPTGIHGLDGLPANDPLWTILNPRLRQIAEDVLGASLFGEKPEDAKELDDRSTDRSISCDQLVQDNSFPHPPFPNDEDWSPTDPSFHHYDVKTPICTIGEQGCDMETLLTDSHSVTRFFTRPSRKMWPDWTVVNNIERESAFVAYPWFIDDPRKYVIQVGYITQNFLTSGNWPGAIENKTTFPHFMHPGTTSRLVINEGGVLKFLTHGIGLNRPLPTLFSTPLNVVLGCANDYWGKKAFETLDQEAIRYWNNSYGAGQSQTQNAILHEINVTTN